MCSYTRTLSSRNRVTDHQPVDTGMACCSNIGVSREGLRWSLKKGHSYLWPPRPRKLMERGHPSLKKMVWTKVQGQVDSGVSRKKGSWRHELLLMLRKHSRFLQSRFYPGSHAPSVTKEPARKVSAPPKASTQNDTPGKGGCFPLPTFEDLTLLLALSGATNEISCHFASVAPQGRIYLSSRAMVSEESEGHLLPRKHGGDRLLPSRCLPPLLPHKGVFMENKNTVHRDKKSFALKKVSLNSIFFL